MLETTGRSATTERPLSPEHQIALQALMRELKTMQLAPHAERYLRDFLQLNLSSPVRPNSVFNALAETYSYESDRRGFTTGCTIFHLLAETKTPLACHHNPDLIPALRACGLTPQINALSKDPFYSKTPLILALENGHHEYAQKLIKNGADPSIAIEGLSALTFALKAGNRPLIDSITNYKGSPVAETDSTRAATNEDIDSLILRVLLGEDDVQFSSSQPAKQAAPAARSPAATLDSLILQYQRLKAENPVENSELKTSQLAVWQKLLASDLNLNEAAQVIEKSDLKQLTFPNGLTVLGEALKNGKTELASRLYRMGCDTLTTRTQATYQIAGQVDPVSEKGLTELAFNYIQKTADSSVVKDACTYFAQVPSPYQLYLFLRSADEIQSEHPNERGLSVFQIASNLLYINQDQRSISSLLEALPKGPALARHRNESDMLLLLNENPEATEASQAGLKMLESLGLSEQRTQRTGSLQREAPVSQIHWALSRIGSLNYSFARLRFDAMSTKVRETDGSEQKLSPSLLSRFGAECISNTDAQQRSVIQRFGSQSYGTQFFFEPGTIQGAFSCFNLDSKTPRETVRTIDAHTTVSLRQGYYLVSNPRHGCLIVRNSSPEFGRMLLADSATYLPASIAAKLSPDDLKFPSQQLLNSGTNPIKVKDPGGVKHINFLIDELQGTLQLYRNWKFDTTSTGAWQDLFERGTKELVGAHLSAGFTHFVSHLRAIYEYHRDSPDVTLALAFVHPDFPSWRQFSYNAPDGSVRRSLPVDDDLIRCLEHLATGDGDERELQTTGFRDFVQQAGLDKQGELMIMSY